MKRKLNVEAKDLSEIQRGDDDVDYDDDVVVAYECFDAEKYYDDCDDYELENAVDAVVSDIKAVVAGMK